MNADKPKPFRIEVIHAFTHVDKDGHEGVVAVFNPKGEWIPLIAADRARLEFYREQAQNIARVTGRKIKVSRFSVREDLEEISP